MSTNREQELQHQCDGLMLRVTQLLKDVDSMRNKRYELESQLAASEEARKKAEAEYARIKREAAEYSADKAIKAKEVMEQNYLVWMEEAKKQQQRAEALEQRISRLSLAGGNMQCENDRLRAEKRIKELELQNSIDKSWNRFSSALNDPVAYGFANSAITGNVHELMMVRLEIPSDDQYPELWIPLYKQPIIPPSLEELQRENAQLSKLLSEARSVPEGWKLVPICPTDAMCEAAHSGPNCAEHHMTVSDRAFWEDCYRAMLSASPNYKEEDL